MGMSRDNIKRHKMEKTKRVEGDEEETIAKRDIKQRKGNERNGERREQKTMHCRGKDGGEKRRSIRQ